MYFEELTLLFPTLNSDQVNPRETPVQDLQYRVTVYIYLSIGLHRLYRFCNMPSPLLADQRRVGIPSIII